MCVNSPMFWDYCPLIDDAWGHYYHNQNYVIWQQNADRIYALTRQCMARGTLSPQLKTAMRVREAAQKQRDADAAEEAAQKSRDAAAEEAAVHERCQWLHELGDLEMLDLDDCVLDV